LNILFLYFFSITFFIFKIKGSGGIYCILNFLFTYYFGMASLIWWCVITVTWFLSSRLNWNNKTIGLYGKYFHLFAWILPSIQTFFVLSLSLIDADSLYGVCSVGNLNRRNLLVFIIIPTVIYLTIGLLFLFASSSKTTMIKKSSSKRLLKVKVVIFSFFFVATTVCSVVINMYEYYNRDKWEKDSICINKPKGICNKKSFQLFDAQHSI
jgi:hypothetical protein